MRWTAALALLAALLWPAAAHAWTPHVARAQKWAQARQGSVTFAVRTEDRLWGRGVDVQVPSASVFKAMLLVTYLRQSGVRHRAYALRLLRTIVPSQRWGMAQVAPAGWTLYFKGGWGSGRGLVDHQVALLRRGRERVSVAILTTVSGTHREGKATLRGVAQRLLRGL